MHYELVCTTRLCTVISLTAKLELVIKGTVQSYWDRLQALPCRTLALKLPIAKGKERETIVLKLLRKISGAKVRASRGSQISVVSGYGNQKDSET